MQRKLLNLLIGALYAGMTAGCASTASDTQAPEQVLAPGAVAVVAAGYAPKVVLATWEQRSAAMDAGKASAWAAKGVGNGAVGSLYASLRMPLLLPFLPVILPVAAIAGGVVGGAAGAVSSAWDAASAASKSIPEAHAAPLRALIERSMDATVQKAMAVHVAEGADELRHYRFVLEPGSGPTVPDEAPEYLLLKAQDFDSVLELAVTSAGFVGTASERPYVNFEMTLRARVVPLKDGGRPWVREWTHRGAGRSAADWHADDGQLLQAELGAAYQAFAQHVAGAMFAPVSAE